MFALVFTAGMFGGYVMMFRGVFVRAEGAGADRGRESYQITTAGLAASRIFAAGGAGGLVLTAWALRRAGMAKRLVADKTLSFLILTYFLYVAALIVRAGPADRAVPRRGAVRPHRRAGRLRGHRARHRAVDRAGADRSPAPARRLGPQRRPAGADRAAARQPAGVGLGRHARRARARALARPGLAGAFLFWGFQILVLWAAFRAFGDSPPAAVLVQAFFVGMLGNLLPMPGASAASRAA